MTTLNGRSWRLELGTIKIESITGRDGSPGKPSLDFEFSIERDKSTDPNNAEFVIYNLNPFSRQVLSYDDVTVRFSAGYRDSMELLFYGQLQHAVSEGGADNITRIDVGDSTSKIVQSRVSKSFARGTLVTDVVDYVMKEIGASRSNWDAFGKAYDTIRTLKLNNAYAMHGSATTALTMLGKSFGFEWCVINDEFQLRAAGAAAGQGPLISPTSGLIGSPQREKKGKISFQCKLMPQILPGYVVQLEHKFAQGPVLIDKTRHYGATSGSDWTIDVEGAYMWKNGLR